MNDFKFELNRAGVAELMKSPEMTQIISEETARINAAAGAGYSSNVQTGRNRVSGRIWPETRKARKDNSDNNTLLKLARAGGGK